MGATTGKLKFNCRNMVGHYDGAGGYTGGSSILHTVDDYNYDGAISGGYPTNNVWGEDKHLCGYGSLAVSERTWERVVTDPATSGENSVFKDKISGLNWTRGNETTTRGWDTASSGGGSGAIEYCADLVHGGLSTWRLPTQKELMAAYEHGIHDLDSEHTSVDHFGDLDRWFWSSTTQSNNLIIAWNVYLNLGNTSNTAKTDTRMVLCVSP